MDRLDPNNAPNPDGWFDFIDGAATTGGTIQSQNGRIYFPVLEPFGSYLDSRLLVGARSTDQADHRLPAACTTAPRPQRRTSRS